MPLHGDAYTAARSRSVFASLGASGAAKMPFYRAAERERSASARAPSRNSTVRARSSPSLPPASPPMDRVRRCTGEMLRATRLKGQLTPSRLAERRGRRRRRRPPASLPTSLLPLACVLLLYPTLLHVRAILRPPASTSSSSWVMAYIFLTVSFSWRSVPFALREIETATSDRLS